MEQVKYDPLTSWSWDHINQEDFDGVDPNWREFKNFFNGSNDPMDPVTDVQLMSHYVMDAPGLKEQIHKDEWSKTGYPPCTRSGLELMLETGVDDDLMDAIDQYNRRYIVRITVLLERVAENLNDWHDGLI